MLYIKTNIYMYNFNKISIFSVCSIDVQIYSSCGEGGVTIFKFILNLIKSIQPSRNPPPPPDLSAGSVVVRKSKYKHMTVH